MGGKSRPKEAGQEPVFLRPKEKLMAFRFRRDARTYWRGGLRNWNAELSGDRYDTDGEHEMIDRIQHGETLGTDRAYLREYSAGVLREVVGY